MYRTHGWGSSLGAGIVSAPATFRYEYKQRYKYKPANLADLTLAVFEEHEVEVSEAAAVQVVHEEQSGSLDLALQHVSHRLPVTNERHHRKRGDDMACCCSNEQIVQVRLQGGWIRTWRS
jgi:hypothetical protein